MTQETHSPLLQGEGPNVPNFKHFVSVSGTVCHPRDIYNRRVREVEGGCFPDPVPVRVTDYGH